jgi:hypothetical protein
VNRPRPVARLPDGGVVAHYAGYDRDVNVAVFAAEEPFDIDVEENESRRCPNDQTRGDLRG